MHPIREFLLYGAFNEGGLLDDPYDRYGHLVMQAFLNTRLVKGRHPAALNYGDCFSYALAKTSGEPLLFKDRDFTQTDIVAVAY